MRLNTSGNVRIYKQGGSTRDKSSHPVNLDAGAAPAPTHWSPADVAMALLQQPEVKALSESHCSSESHTCMFCLNVRAFAAHFGPSEHKATVKKVQHLRQQGGNFPFSQCQRPTSIPSTDLSLFQLVKALIKICLFKSAHFHFPS